jgi:hypothetical protein
MLVDPVAGFPSFFGPHSFFGGQHGVQWMSDHPFALTNILSGILQFMGAALVYLYLRETLKARVQTKAPDLRDIIQSFVPRWTRKSLRPSMNRVKSGRTPDLQSQGLLDNSDDDVEMDHMKDKHIAHSQINYSKPVQRLPFSRIWTSNVIFTLLSTAIFDFHMG